MSIYRKTLRARNVQFSSFVKVFIGLFLTAAIIFPLFSMLGNMSRTNIAEIVQSAQFKPALFHSIAVAGTATIISIVIAYIFALCLVRSNMPFREITAVFVTLPMLIPSISHGMGLVLLLGSNGILTRMFNLSHSIYGFSGIVTGSVLYAFPVAFLMLADILKYEDGSPYEAAEVLGIPRLNRFFSISFAYLRKPLISVVFAVFTLIFTDYGVPLMIGGRYTTLPVLMYQEVIGLLHFDKGSVIGSFLLIPAVIAFLFDLFNKDLSNQGFVSRQKTKKEHKLRDMLASLYSIVVCALIALPIVVFALLTFVKQYPLDMSFSLSNITKTLDMGAGKYLANSLIISTGVAVLGTILSYVVAYFTARTRGNTSRFLHLVSITSLAIPGMVLGLSYVLFFKGSFIYGTFSMLILVNTVHFMASPYLMAYNSLGKLNGNLEDVGRTLGIGRLHVIIDVLIPQTKHTVLEMISCFFVNSMMTISAVSFLSTMGNKPVSLMITEFEGQLFLEGAAFVSLLILVCNFTVKTLIYFLEKRFREV
ncbi:MAG: ABC transporter permease subunit [Spirochaetaceae bacterium]|jgi:iron(III) transport system permease protein|nr:ABC transporter permease subunit [Spirochaetaceae bacterium]